MVSWDAGATNRLIISQWCALHNAPGPGTASTKKVWFCIDIMFVRICSLISSTAYYLHSSRWLFLAAVFISVGMTES